jgi:hypothetical protein
MANYITGMKFSTLCLLACGAVVREGKTLACLEDMVKRYGLVALIFSILINSIACGLQMPSPLGLST